jgi:hypothetical protein
MNKIKLMYGLLALFAVSSPIARSAWSQTQVGTVSGKFVVEAPTLTAIGVEWTIAGDDNRNATVEVSYRKKGEQPWHQALPLLRIHHEIINDNRVPWQTVPFAGRPPNGDRENLWHYDTGNLFSGSILSLEPNTEYECRFVLSDPDGVKGTKEKTITVRTRKVPEPAQGGHVYNVYPIGWNGPMQQPAFVGLMRAYYMGSSSSDHSATFPARVQPGDTILVHAGVYVSDRFHYLDGLPHPGYDALAPVTDGTYYLTASGTPDKPIVIKSAGDGEVIFDGAGNEYLFNLLRANYNYFEGITVRNTAIAFLLGWKDITGSSGFTLKNSRVYDIQRAVQAEWSGSRDFYIADSVFIGREHPSKMEGGGPLAAYPGFPELLLSEYAIKLYGQGHVVTHNYVADFHDAIDVSTYGEPDGTPDIASDKLTGPTEMDDRVAASIDFDHNDIYNMSDNCFETDGTAHNARVFENRCFNDTAAAISAQPIFGGPVYWYKNLVYNVLRGGALKYDETPAGVLVYQNTFVDADTSAGTGIGPDTVANAHHLNNLFIGRGDSDPDYVVSTTTNYTSSDYNGFSSNAGEYNFGWNSPPFNIAADYGFTGDQAKLTVRRFKTLAEYSQATGQDKHSVMVGYDTFVNVPMADNSDPQHLYNPEDMDFRLRPNSPAVDAGIVLPTINDGYKGKAPDIGAFELGLPMPQYGPRTWPVGMIGPSQMSFRSWSGPQRKDELPERNGVKMIDPLPQ